MRPYDCQDPLALDEALSAIRKQRVMSPRIGITTTEVLTMGRVESEGRYGQAVTV